MGGIIILASVILTSLIYVKDYPKIIPILFVNRRIRNCRISDDYLKVVLKTFRWSVSMAEDALSDCDYGNFCILY